MGSEGKTTIWNYDRIKAEAKKRGGTVAEHYGENGTFAFYVYDNPLSNDPKQLGVAYWDPTKQFTPMSFFGTWENDEFWWKEFARDYKRNFSGSSMEAGLNKTQLREHFDFVVWCCENALIANWEVWT